MTSGSGNGWPDVVKVPAQKVGHDPYCQWPRIPCQCADFAAARADERKSVKAEYVPVLMEHLRILADLRAKVEASEHEARTMAANPSTGPLWLVRADAFADVLALIGGSDD